MRCGIKLKKTHVLDNFLYRTPSREPRIQKRKFAQVSGFRKAVGSTVSEMKQRIFLRNTKKQV